MSPSESSGIPPDILADLEDVARQAATGGVRDPELLRRVYERSAKARDELRQKYGVLDIGVDIIREIRDGV
ncbi:MAG TPA: hypothetical protein VG013_19800 [Gemmataceae bacterium]|jgi:hypothetical protein|nr:hypothetical protein [Gemmataceae bacterium]